MNFKENPIEVAGKLPMVPESLMQPEQAAYYLAWHELIGDRSKVIYNAMGPDISTVLLMNNPDVVIGVDLQRFFDKYSYQYIEKYWDIIDSKLFLPPSVLETNPNSRFDYYTEGDEDWTLFFNDLDSRVNRGYYDEGIVGRWGIDRLMLMELKKMGVDPQTIEVGFENIGGFDVPLLGFDWAYPGERLKRRTVVGLPGPLERLLRYKETKKLLKGAATYYQKSLPGSRYQLQYLDAIKSLLAPEVVVAMGYTFDQFKKNNEYQEELRERLADFQLLKLDPRYEEMIDGLPTNPDKGVDSYHIGYGMKLHVFGR